MKLYEMIFVVKNELVEEQVNSIANNFSEFIKSNAGELKFQHYFGVRSLAYEIQKNKKGHYYVMHFFLEPALIAELDRDIRLNEDIIRHIIVNIEASDPDSVISMLTIKDRDVDLVDDDFSENTTTNSQKDTGYRQKADTANAQEDNSVEG